jgi:transcription antitermination factor NusG
MNETNPTNEEKHWYAVYTNPRVEKKLSKLLQKYGIQNYLPLILEKRKWSDRIKEVEVPCFKSYIFVKIEFWKERVKVLQLPGSHHFVFAKGVPAIIDETHILALQTTLQMRTESVEVRENEALTKGKMVKVISGPLEGYVLEVEKRKNKVAVFLRFPFMNQMVISEVKIEDIMWEDLKL